MPDNLKISVHNKMPTPEIYFRQLESKLSTENLTESLNTENRGSPGSISALELNKSKSNTDLNKYLEYKPEEKYVNKIKTADLSSEIKSHLQVFK